MSKKTNRKAPPAAAMTAADLEQASTKSKVIAQGVRNDMQAAENGMFYALRAGVGMLKIKELYEHGDWANALLELFPDRAPTTLRTYMRVGRNFCDAKQLRVADAWNGLQTIRTDRLLGAPGDAGNPKGGKSGELEKDVREFVKEFGSIRKAEKGEPEEESKAGGMLTRAERLEAARAIWNKIANLAQDQLERHSAEVLPDEDLDGIACVLRTVSDTLRKQLAQRTTKI